MPGAEKRCSRRSDGRFWAYGLGHRDPLKDLARRSYRHLNELINSIRITPVTQEELNKDLKYPEPVRPTSADEILNLLKQAAMPSSVVTHITTDLTHVLR